MPSCVSWVVMCVLAVAALATSSAAQPAQGDSTIPVDKVSGDLAALLKKMFPNGKITGAENKDLRGTHIDLSVLDGKRQFHVTVLNVNGYCQITDFSRNISPSEAPQSVLDAVRAKHPNAKLDSGREVHDVSTDCNEYYVRVKAAGDEELEIFLVPEFKNNSAGEYKPTGKMLIASETPMVGEFAKWLVDLIKKKIPNGKITSAKMLPHYPMDEGGSMGVTVMEGKEKFHVTINCANGDIKINTISHDIAPSELPKFVLNAIHVKYPDARIHSAQEVQDGLMGWFKDYPKPSDYFVRIKTTGNKELDLTLSADRKLGADGQYERVPGKVMITSERPADKDEDKTP
jgi:hypothetical protein